MTLEPFPVTRYSVVRDLCEGGGELRERAFATVVTAYWKPIYTYLRLFKRVAREDAEDYTQGFFAHALEKKVLESFDPERARFRTWVRTCLEGYVANERKAASRLKRGGAYRHVPLDFETAEGELVHIDLPASDDVEAFFHREWVRGLLSSAVEELRAESGEASRELDFALFAAYDLADDDASRPSYADLSREHGVPPTKVTNALHAMRRRLRERIVERLRALSATDDEFRAEYRALFGERR